MADNIEKQTKGSVKVVQMSTYTSPNIVERKNKAWVEYGDDNNYYGYLIDMFHGSPTNNRCIKGIADLIYGQGMEAKRSNRNLPDYVTFKRMFSEHCLRNVAQDLKMLGEGSFQIVRSKDRKKLAKVYHFPIHTLRPAKCNEKGEIEAYYYYPDWANIKRGAEPKRIPNFEFNPEAPESILVIRPYSTGSFYFSPVDYQGGLQYAELECEIANYHINNIKNGMAPSMLINFNNGEPPEEQKTSIENAILNKFSGSSATGKVVISWNDDPNNKADITPVPLSDAHNQYQFLSTESQDKILVAHGITSPLIFGIKNVANGFSSNADELTTGIKIFDNMVIRPFQLMIIEAVNQILAEADINLELYFKPLNPLDGEEIESTSGKMGFTQNTPTLLSSNSIEMSSDDETSWLEFLNDKGEILDENEWELIDTAIVNDEELDGHQYNFFQSFADPNEKSNDDKGIYKIRYRYGPDSTSKNSRDFCKQMVGARKGGLVYRREDIVEMGEAGINGQFAPKGKSSYSIWKFKGGVACHHYWERLTFRRKYKAGWGNVPVPLTSKEKGSTYRDLDNNYTDVPNSEANQKGVPFSPPEWSTAQTKPIDMPNQGRLKK